MGSPKRVLQESRIQPEPELRPLDQHHQPRNLRRPRRVIESPWFTSREAMQFLGFDSISVLYYHIRENRLPFHRIGGRYRFNRLELTAWVEGQRPALRVVGL